MICRPNSLPANLTSLGPSLPLIQPRASQNRSLKTLDYMKHTPKGHAFVILALILPAMAMAAWTANESIYLPNGTYGGDTEFSESGNLCEGAVLLEQYNWSGNASGWWAIYRWGHPITYESQSGNAAYVFASVVTNDSSAYWAECHATLIDADGSVLASKN